MKNFNLPIFGAGVGLRHEHFASVISERPPVNWFEIIVENFLDFGGWTKEAFEEIASHYRIIPHGVCLSIGSTDELDIDFLHRLKPFLDSINAPCMSDHLCFTMVDHTNLNELIPLPFTSEAVKNVATRISVVQDILERPFMVENVTRYITVSDREMGEAEFISSILEQANCGLLLDLTNVHLNSIYHGYDAKEFIASLPLERVGQMHLAGFEDDGDVLLDAHDAPVPEEVWELFKFTLQRTGPTNPLVEWDNNLPTVHRVLQEAEIADAMMSEICPEYSRETLAVNGKRPDSTTEGTSGSSLQNPLVHG